jgi:hypothetical protein
VCYDVNPLSMKQHLRELDRQAGLSRRPRSNILVTPRKAGRALVALARHLRNRLGGEPHEQQAGYEPSITTG